jgi:hypothetical protein
MDECVEMSEQWLKLYGENNIIGRDLSTLARLQRPFISSTHAKLMSQNEKSACFKYLSTQAKHSSLIPYQNVRSPVQVLLPNIEQFCNF